MIVPCGPDATTYIYIYLFRVRNTVRIFIESQMFKWTEVVNKDNNKLSKSCNEQTKRYCLGTPESHQKEFLQISQRIKMNKTKILRLILSCHQLFLHYYYCPVALPSVLCARLFLIQITL